MCSIDPSMMEQKGQEPQGQEPQGQEAKQPQAWQKLEWRSSEERWRQQSPPRGMTGARVPPVLQLVVTSMPGAGQIASRRHVTPRESGPVARASR